MLAACLQDAGIASVGTVRDSARTRLPCGVVLRRFDGQRADAALTAGIAATDAVPTPIPQDADGGPTCRRFADALAASCAGRIAYPSSTGGYGDLGGGRIDETAVADARHPAALTWFAAEVQRRAIGERAGVPVAVLVRAWPQRVGAAGLRPRAPRRSSRLGVFAPARGGPGRGLVRAAVSAAAEGFRWLTTKPRRHRTCWPMLRRCPACPCRPRRIGVARSGVAGKRAALYQVGRRIVAASPELPRRPARVAGRRRRPYGGGLAQPAFDLRDQRLDGQLRGAR